MPKRIDLGEPGQEPWVEIADLTGEDVMEYECLIDDIRRGKGVPLVLREVDPDNTTEMITRPNPAAAFTQRDNYQAYDWVVRRAVSRFPWPLPDGVAQPGEPGFRRAIPLEWAEAFNGAILEIIEVINNGPKPTGTGTTSGSTSGSDAPAPRTE